jgi:hypothetical protein
VSLTMAAIGQLGCGQGARWRGTVAMSPSSRLSISPATTASTIGIDPELHCPKVSGFCDLVSGFLRLVTVWLHVGRGGVTGSDGP